MATTKATAATSPRAATPTERRLAARLAILARHERRDRPLDLDALLDRPMVLSEILAGLDADLAEQSERERIEAEATAARERQQATLAEQKLSTAIDAIDDALTASATLDDAAAAALLAPLVRDLAGRLRHGALAGRGAALRPQLRELANAVAELVVAFERALNPDRGIRGELIAALLIPTPTTTTD